MTGTPVREIRWESGRVEVITDAGSLSAPRAVVTLPLGVLQSGDVAISPKPELIFEAAGQLSMGQARRLYVAVSGAILGAPIAAAGAERIELSVFVFRDASGMVDATSGGEQQHHRVGRWTALGGAGRNRRGGTWAQGMHDAGKDLWRGGESGSRTVARLLYA